MKRDRYRKKKMAERLIVREGEGADRERDREKEGEKEACDVLHFIKYSL